MALMKIAKEKREREERKKTESYSIGGESPISPTICVPGHNDIADALHTKLGDYGEFYKRPKPRGTFGGRIQDDVWDVSLADDQCREMDIVVTQRYAQPGARMHYARVDLSYDKEIAKEDLEVVRRALKESGLAKI